MATIPLSATDLAIASALVLALAATSMAMRLGLAGKLVVAALRTSIQLTLIGLVLKSLFAHVHPMWMAVVAAVMIGVAAYEVRARQRRRFRGMWGVGIGGVSMFVSSFAVTVLALLAVVRPDPWYEPRYAVPLLGMMTGNTMTGIALGLNHLAEGAHAARGSIEARLILGANADEAILEQRRDSIRTGLIPMISSMAAAGLVSLPGMMTGQILAGNPPADAVRYQILIMFMIASGTGFGVIAAVTIGARRLFDERARLRLDRLSG
ncbi:MAG: ABC transporter permease [Planctomycetota bacterium]|jgi:putative ABC transport system permease protein